MIAGETKVFKEGIVKKLDISLSMDRDTFIKLLNRVRQPSFNNGFFMVSSLCVDLCHIPILFSLLHLVVEYAGEMS